MNDCVLFTHMVISVFVMHCIRDALFPQPPVIIGIIYIPIIVTLDGKNNIYYWPPKCGRLQDGYDMHVSNQPFAYIFLEYRETVWLNKTNYNLVKTQMELVFVYTSGYTGQTGYQISNYRKVQLRPSFQELSKGDVGNGWSMFFDVIIVRTSKLL